MSMDVSQIGSTKLEILRIILNKDCSILELSKDLNMSAAAVRQHIQYLLATDMLVRRKFSYRPSRPTYIYSLSERGKEFFPNQCRLLLRLILDAMVEAASEPKNHQGLIEDAANIFAREHSNILNFIALEHRSSEIIAWLKKEFNLDAQPTEDGKIIVKALICPFNNSSVFAKGACGIFFDKLLSKLGNVAKSTVSNGSTSGCCNFVIG